MHEAPERVLSTLNEDGTRRWLDPKVATGVLWKRRRVVAWALIALFVSLPWIRINGRPGVLLNIPEREFTFFGATFLPTDTLLLALFMGSVFVGIFLLTALFGRVWCGWACPQTVYMEFVYRPIERFWIGPGSGNRGRKRNVPGSRRAGMYATYLVVSLILAHVFLSYFVGTAQLFEWMQQSPLQHPKSFLLTMAVTGAMMFNFAFFREQTCIVACPYGRFQSALLDRQSMIVAYDAARGEPRGHATRKGDGDVALPQLGDCIDCTMCVQVCPTGIDIRDGLQMECVNCTQCIDACNEIMTRIKRPLGLIRYSSQEALEGGPRRLIRPRVILYPALLTVFVSLFVIVLVTKQPADVTLLRAIERPYATLDSGEIQNNIRIKIVNRTDQPQTYRFTVEGLEGGRIELQSPNVTVEAGATVTIPAGIVAPASVFSGGRGACRVRVEDEGDFSRSFPMGLQGPFGSTRVDSPAPPAESAMIITHESGDSA
jgi:cytochrome c oxidase accessory protein FixG